MADLLISKTIQDNVYKVTFQLINLTPTERILIETFDEPSYTFGGSFNPKNKAFLQSYFPNSKELIDDWVQFQSYTDGAEVQYTDGFYYRALQDVDFPFPEWVQFQSAALLWNGTDTYSSGDVVYYQPDGNFYEANQAVAAGEDPISTPAKWDQTEVVREYTNDKYYKALREIDFTLIPDWVAGQRYSEGNDVEFTNGNYYNAKKDSPLAWDSNTQYELGDLVWYSGAFYEATVTAPRPGTNILATLISVTGTAGSEFIAGDTVTGGTSGATGEVVDWDEPAKELEIEVTSGTFQVGETISVTSGAGDGSATVSSIEQSNPAANTDEWSTTVKADPVTDGGEFWEIHTEFEPTKDDGIYWEVFTDRDPGVSGSQYWTAFTPSGEEPSSTKSFTVNQIIRDLPSGLPITFEFNADNLSEAEENGDDFAVVVRTDIKDIWDEFQSNADTFTETEVIEL